MSGIEPVNVVSRSARQKFVMESGGFAVAEIVGAVVGLGIVGVADKVAPGLVKSTTQAISAVAIEPYLDNIEWVLGKVCKLEECKVDKTKTRQERAERLARAITLFGAAWVPSLAAKIATRRGINAVCGMGDKAPWWNVLKANEHDKALFWWDEGVHYGSMVLLNTTKTGAGLSDEMLRSTTNLLQKIGFSENTAHDMAAMAVIHELPNFLGFSAGVGKIAYDCFGAKSHVEKLAAHTALSGQFDFSKS